ncbi:hypothetical protein [Saccharothrix hoggarensis]|uniref:Ig-like domain-containing protein n=1 Tax=Saccharothrix hoggarensis TaxID=913853 RepID=A0ABW3QTU6_9PSEU
MRKRILFATTLAASVLFAPVAASAQSAAGWSYPNPAEAGSSGTVTVMCGGALPPVGIWSDAFASVGPLSPTGDNGGNVVYSGPVKFIDEPGTYPARVRCARQDYQDGGSITLKPAGSLEPVLTLRPTTLQPGGTITAGVPNGACRYQDGSLGPIRSDGFVEPIHTVVDPTLESHVGSGQVVNRPGTYQARATCGKGEVSASFTVVAAADPAPKPDPQPKPKPQPQVPVKPVGAPQTGGGGTA